MCVCLGEFLHAVYVSKEKRNESTIRGKELMISERRRQGQQQPCLRSREGGLLRLRTAKIESDSRILIVNYPIIPIVSILSFGGSLLRLVSRNL